MLWQWLIIAVLVVVAAIVLIRRIRQTFRLRCCEGCGKKPINRLLKQRAQVDKVE